MALKPSLLEWKQKKYEPDPPQAATLKPSLGEWKREEEKARREVEKALETFLGGMETAYSGPFLATGTALKPSLVEWKRVELR